MRVVVAGAAGNLGTEVTTTLIEAGHNMVAIDANPQPRLQPVRERLAGLYTLDLCQLESIDPCLEAADVVITTVGIGRPRRLSDFQEVDYQCNLNLLRAAQQAGVKRFIRRVRCPNYLGEITFWIGNWIMGVALYNTPLEWIVSALGLAGIIFIMVGSTRRLESTQLARYGNLPEYQQCAQTVPVLFPYLPLYRLQNTCILFG